MAPLNESELYAGTQCGTYKDFCERMGITDPLIIARAEKLDGGR